jgi:hypothetical protein
VPPGTLQTKISGSDRAIAVQIDAQHGMVDRSQRAITSTSSSGVNRWLRGSQPIIKLLMEDVTVLRAPVGSGSGLYTLRATGRQAAVLAFASDNGRLWFVLRPASGAKIVNPGFVSTQSLLLGLKPVR